MMRKKIRDLEEEEKTIRESKGENEGGNTRKMKRIKNLHIFLLLLPKNFNNDPLQIVIDTDTNLHHRASNSRQQVST